MSFTIENIGDDILDVRDIIDELEALDTDDDEGAEHAAIIEKILDELRGYGGDHQWQGDWFPCELIEEDYFQEYCKDLAEDCGLIQADAAWPMRHIDWEAAADEARIDYSEIEIQHNGSTFTYLYR